MNARQPLGPWSTLIMVLFVFTPLGFAQTPIGGTISDGAGGPLLSGTVYHVTSNLLVPTGQTLTVQPGAIVKFGIAQAITVTGNLNVTASLANPAIFTSLSDDTAGGDTPSDGPTTGSAGYWRGISITLSGVAQLTGLETRFSGQSNLATISLAPNVGTTITDCVIRDYAGVGIDYQSGGIATISGCQFLNGTRPVINCPPNGLPNFTNNQASGNSVNNSVSLSNAQAVGNFTVPASSVMGGAHIMTANLVIAAGAVMNVDAGVNFKSGAAALQVIVNGQLFCNGSGANPVVFTAIADDVYGGDTNNNGPSSASQGFWRGIQFNDTADGSALLHTYVRFSGQSSIASVELLDADVSLTSCRFEHCNVAGVDLNSNSSLPIITNCHFEAVSVPIDNASWTSIPNFTNNTSANITGTDAIRVSAALLVVDTTITPTNLINSVLVHETNLTIPPGLTLTLGAGVILKTANAATRIMVDGTLDCQGTAGNEVVFTYLLDDTHGGDTNTDGPSLGSVSYWRGLLFSAGSDASQLTHTRLRFSGQSSFAGVTIADADITMTNCVIEDCGADGLDLANSQALPTISGCAFDRCVVAVDQVQLEQLPGFTSNSATGNTQRDSIRVTGNTLSTAVSLTKTNLINDVIEIVGNQTISNTAALTLGSGIVVKMASAATLIDVLGVLTCNGTSGEPVVFTSLADDQHAGDTAINGPSVGAPGFWRGVHFQSGSDASALEHVILRFSGQSSLAGVEVFGSNFSMTDSTISDCGAAALDFNAMSSTPTIRNCAFNTSSHAIRGARWENFTNLRDNTASGNVVYDAPLVESGAVPVSTEVHARSMINGCFVTNAQPTTVSGATLTFHRGCVVKTLGVLQYGTFNGGFELLGTGSEPIVFTVIGDDEYAGDTNKNGPSTGSAGLWRGLSLTGPARIEYALVRYAGQSTIPGIQVSSSLASLKSVRVEHCSNDGIDIVPTTIASDLDNLVAFNCGAIGIDMNQSTQDLRFATVTGCNIGIRLGVNFMGVVDGCNSFGNNQNYSGANSSNLFNSNGDAPLAGTNGNINADPLFVDASTAVGDLELQLASPCIDAANFALGMTVAADHRESSRLNDHDLDGIVGCDMGAYEFTNYRMSITGQPVLGQTMSFTLEGLPGIGQICIALLDGQSYMSPFGMVLVGTPATVLLEDIVHEGYGYPLTVPNQPQFIGTEFGVQMGGAALGDTTTGNITNLYRGVVQD